jgi:hypothetical protein
LNEFSEQFTTGTFKEIEKWFEIGIINWGHTDVICGMIISEFFTRNIITIDALTDWRTSRNKYQRRAVPVAMIEILKDNANYKSLFEFIEPLMTDEERMVRQGLGWFLREAWKIRKKETEAFLFKWKNEAPRLIYQYATEKMTAQEKKRFKKEKKQQSKTWLTNSTAGNTRNHPHIKKLRGGFFLRRHEGSLKSAFRNSCQGPFWQLYCSLRLLPSG